MGHRSVPSRQISPLSLLKCGLTAPKSPKFVILGINLPKGGIPLKRFLPNLACERESQVRTLLPNFTVVAYKIWAYSPKIAKIGIFGINLPKRGIPPLCDFLQNLVWGRSPRSAPSRQISSLWLLKCGFTAPKIVKNGNFWYTFAPKEKFRGRQIKLDIGAQLQTSLYAITLSISLSHVHC